MKAHGGLQGRTKKVYKMPYVNFHKPPGFDPRVRPGGCCREAFALSAAACAQTLPAMARALGARIGPLDAPRSRAHPTSPTYVPCSCLLRARSRSPSSPWLV